MWKEKFADQKKRPNKDLHTEIEGKKENGEIDLYLI